MDDRALRWIQYNQRGALDGGVPPERAGQLPEPRGRGRHRGAAERVGAVARQVLSSPGVRGSAMHRRVQALLEERCGEALLAHATLTGVRSGTVRIEIDDPALLCMVRLEWEQRILDVIQTELPGAGIHEIRFAVGRPG